MTTCVWTGVASARHAESSHPAGFVDLCSQAASKNNMIENTVVFAHGTRCVRFCRRTCDVVDSGWPTQAWVI